uniref:Uncharacterized protein n=1 Tax=Rhizophora mucronata TaxID=61149 RepID=A0A2P2MXY0_RHIMU
MESREGLNVQGQAAISSKALKKELRPSKYNHFKPTEASYQEN